MTALDVELRQAVFDIAAELGLDCVFSQWADSDVGSFDPGSAERLGGDGTPTQTTIKCLPPGEYLKKWGVVAPIKAGETQLGVPALNTTITLALGDGVTFDSTGWRIMEIKPIYSGEQVCLYILTLKGSGG